MPDESQRLNNSIARIEKAAQLVRYINLSTTMDRAGAIDMRNAYLRKAQALYEDLHALAPTNPH